MSSLDRQFSFTVALSTRMYKWEPVIIILGRRATTNLSFSRYETLDLVTTNHITCSKHTQLSWELSLLIMEIGVNQQFYSWGAIKMVQVRSASKKLNIVFYHVIKAVVVFKGESTSSPVQYLVCSTRIYSGCHHGSVPTKIAINEKSR